jgi:hypothetical protein
VWVLRDNQPVPVDVTVGATDAVMTEILTGDLTVGAAVLVDFLTSG